MEKQFIKNNVVVVAVYSHPEYYPPTLNAIDELALKFDEVIVLSRNVFESNWNYPQNVRLVYSGKKIGIRESEQLNIFLKVLSFLMFALKLLKLTYQKKPKLIQVCDSLPLFSLYIIKPLLNRKIKFWYHNHDVVELKYTRKFSLSWFAFHCQNKMFSNLDIFSLPSLDRKFFFPMENLKGQFYYLPNYPSIHRMLRPKTCKNAKLKVVFQGEISRNLGIGELIDAIPMQKENELINLHLIGNIEKEFQKELLSQIQINKLSSHIILHGFTPYFDMLKLSFQCDIGWAVYTSDTTIMYNHIVTASNKIYEYAAAGLPVILYNSAQFYECLSKYQWCFFTDLSHDSLKDCFFKINENYHELSTLARHDYENELNYGKYFKELLIEI